MVQVLPPCRFLPISCSSFSLRFSWFLQVTCTMILFVQNYVVFVLHVPFVCGSVEFSTQVLKHMQVLWFSQLPINQHAVEFDHRHGVGMSQSPLMPKGWVPGRPHPDSWVP